MQEYKQMIVSIMRMYAQCMRESKNDILVYSTGVLKQGAK